MNLAQLRYFKKLAETLKFSRAAKELYVTQPSLSGSISSLEKELGTPLFDRTGQGLALTERGKVFYEYVCVALQSIDDGVSTIKENELPLQGVITLGTTFTLQTDYVPSLVMSYRNKRGASIIVKIFQGFTNYLTEQLHKGTIDVAFCGKREGETDIEYYPVTARNLVLCVRKDHEFAGREVVSFKDIAHMDLVSYRDGTPIGELVTALLERNKVTNVCQLYDDDISMGSAVSFGQTTGALMLESPGIRLYDNLTAVKVEEIPDQFYWIYLAYHVKHPRTRTVDDFISFVKNYDGKDAQQRHERAYMK